MSSGLPSREPLGGSCGTVSGEGASSAAAAPALKEEIQPDGSRCGGGRVEGVRPWPAASDGVDEEWREQLASNR